MAVQHELAVQVRSDGHDDDFLHLRSKLWRTEDFEGGLPERRGDFGGSQMGVEGSNESTVRERVGEFIAKARSHLGKGVIERALGIGKLRGGERWASFAHVGTRWV